MKKPAIDHQTVYVPVEADSSTQHLNLRKAVPAPAMPNLKFSSASVTLRMPASLLVKLKSLANQRDVPYQSLMKILLAQAIERETVRPMNK
jgi:predicted DNA binding CopG/RHH family protein